MEIPVFPFSLENRHISRKRQLERYQKLLGDFLFLPPLPFPSPLPPFLPLLPPSPALSSFLFPSPPPLRSRPP